MSVAMSGLRGHATVTGIDAPLQVRRRLAEMGIRDGAQVRVLRRSSGGGIVIAVNGSRVALDGRLAAAIQAEPDD